MWDLTVVLNQLVQKAGVLSEIPRVVNQVKEGRSVIK